MQAAGLIWSPNIGTGSGTAEDALVNQIDTAKKTVYFTSEELSDARIYGALAADARRHVTCEIVMTNSSEWDTGFKAVTAAGCKVHVYPDSVHDIYIHEKIIFDDAGTSNASLLIGSQNASEYSLTRNREAGLLLTNAGPLARVGETGQVVLGPELVDDNIGVGADPTVVQERLTGLPRLLRVDVAMLPRKRKNLAEQSAMQVIQMGNVQAPRAIRVGTQRGLGVGTHDPLEDRDRSRIGKPGDGTQHRAAWHQVGQPLRTLVRVTGL